MTHSDEVTIKDKFLDAVINNDIGKDDGFGVVVTLKEFRKHFKDEITSDYINSFLPAAVMDGNQENPSHTKYLKRAKKGIYRVHPDAIENHKHNKNINQEPSEDETTQSFSCE